MTTPPEVLAGLPLAEADRYAVAQMQAAREAMATWSAARAARIWAEIQQGRTRSEIAKELGVSAPVVKTLLTRHGYPAGQRGRPKGQKTESAGDEPTDSPTEGDQL